MIPLCILAIENQNDRDYMTAIYNKYHRLMYYTILQIVANDYLAEDTMQSVLVKLIQKIDKLRTMDERSVRKYIVIACKNTALNEVRNREKHPTYPLDEEEETDNNGYESKSLELHVIRQEDMDNFSRIWGQLDQRSQYILEGYYILEKSPVELANDLGIKPNSFRMALFRAREKAYQLFKDIREE